MSLSWGWLLLQDTGEQLHALEKTLKEKETQHVMKVASLKNLNETLEAEEKKKKQLKKSLADVSLCVCVCVCRCVYVINSHINKSST